MPDEPISLGPMALNELHARDQAAGIDPFAVERSPEPEPQQTRVERGLRIEPADWAAEERERRERERAARVAEASALLEADRPPARPDPPATKQRKSWRRSTA